MQEPGIAEWMSGRALAFGAVLTLTFAVADVAPAQADLLEEIKQRGTFVVGTEARFPPFEFVEGGEIVGYSSDMMDHIMEELPASRWSSSIYPGRAFCPGSPPSASTTSLPQ